MTSRITRVPVQTFQPTVTVILPTFNRLQYLRQSVDSVFAQKYSDWELLVADDGSQDETRAYLSGLAARPRVKVLWLPHTGNPGAARNAALREARGDYIAFLDSDDLWMPSKLELQLAALRACPSRQWSYTAIIHINQAGEQIYSELNPRYVYPEGQVFESLLTSKAAIALPTIMVGRRLLERVGGFDERQLQQEDYHLWLRLALLCEINVVRQPLACVRHHNDHFSSRGIVFFEEKDSMLEKIQTLPMTSRQREAVRTARARNAALLAAANAAAGRSDAAWRALGSNWRLSWRRAFWWRGIARVVAHKYIPAQLIAMVRKYRAARRVSFSHPRAVD
jgi:glycosyltransferase involved in cell wall biosynthesis